MQVHRQWSAIAASVVLCTLAASSRAIAHVTLWPNQSQPGVIERYTVRVPSEGAIATTAVELVVPPEVRTIWIVAPNGYTYEAERTNNRITRIVWKREIKPGEVGEFAFFAVNPHAVSVRWTARQTFVDGTTVEWAAVVTLVDPPKATGQSDDQGHGGHPAPHRGPEGQEQSPGTR